MALTREGRHDSPPYYLSRRVKDFATLMIKRTTFSVWPVASVRFNIDNARYWFPVEFLLNQTAELNKNQTHNSIVLTHKLTLTILTTQVKFNGTTLSKNEFNILFKVLEEWWEDLTLSVEGEKSWRDDIKRNHQNQIYDLNTGQLVDLQTSFISLMAFIILRNVLHSKNTLGIPCQNLTSLEIINILRSLPSTTNIFQTRNLNNILYRAIQDITPQQLNNYKSYVPNLFNFAPSFFEYRNIQIERIPEMLNKCKEYLQTIESIPLPPNISSSYNSERIYDNLTKLPCPNSCCYQGEHTSNILRRNFSDSPGYQYPTQITYALRFKQIMNRSFFYQLLKGNIEVIRVAFRFNIKFPKLICKSYTEICPIPSDPHQLIIELNFVGCDYFFGICKLANQVVFVSHVMPTIISFPKISGFPLSIRKNQEKCTCKACNLVRLTKIYNNTLQMKCVAAIRLYLCELHFSSRFWDPIQQHLNIILDFPGMMKLYGWNRLTEYLFKQLA
jgi:hypothetical protein